MNIKQTILLSLLVGAMGLLGCDVGNAPAGMSPEEARANFEKQSPEEQIKMIQSSPASAQEKETRIAEIRKKHHLPQTSEGGAGAPSSGGFPGDPRRGP